jgi:hypothetical protein
MGNRLPRFRTSLTSVLGAATLTLLWLPGATHAQSTAMQSTAMQSAAAQDKQAVPVDDITRRDLAQFDQFLDGHRDAAEQLRKTPSLIDDPQFLQSHPELNAYLQDHPGVKQDISQRPDTFMRMEDLYDRDANLRDRDAGGPDRDGNPAAGDRDRNRADMTGFDRFLDGHREIAEQVRKDPSLVDNREFVQNHPALQSYLQENPGVRDVLRQDPNAFMQQDRDANLRDRDSGGPDRDPLRADAVNQDRDAGRQNRDDRADRVNFNRFLDGHREIAEQVRKDPSLCDNRDFVQNHPALQAYFQDNPGVRDQLRQDPHAFMQQAQQDRNWNMGDRDAMHDRMADFGGFLGSHSDIKRDLSRDPSVVKNPDYVQNHAELNAYLNAHPDVRDGLMANPQTFVHGAQQYNNGSATGIAGGAGVNGRGTGTAASSTGTSTHPATTPHNPKPNQ